MIALQHRAVIIAQGIGGNVRALFGGDVHTWLELATGIMLNLEDACLATAMFTILGVYRRQITHCRDVVSQG